MSIQFSAMDLLVGLYIAVGIFLLVVLYHVLFIVVDVRKVMRRAESITAQLEAIVSKPLSLTDQAFQWVIDYFENNEKKHDKKKHVIHPKQE